MESGYFHITSLLIASVVHYVCPFRKCHIPSHTILLDLPILQSVIIII